MPDSAITSQIRSRSSRVPCPMPYCRVVAPCSDASRPSISPTASSGRAAMYGSAAGERDDLGPVGHGEEGSDLGCGHAAHPPGVPIGVVVERRAGHALILTFGRWLVDRRLPPPNRAGGYPNGVHMTDVTFVGDRCSTTGQTDQSVRPLPSCVVPRVRSLVGAGRGTRHRLDDRGMRHMSRRLVNLTLDTLEDLPRPCRQCVYWELDPVSAERACAAGDPGLEKEAWVSQTLLEWGSCGKLVYVDGMPAGFVMFAPPAYVPALDGLPDLAGLGRRRAADDRPRGRRVRRRRAGPDAGAGRRARPDQARRQGDRGVRRREVRRRRRATARWAASRRPTSSCRWASRRYGRTRATRGCAWSCAPRCRGSPTWSTRWRSCSAR